MMQNFVVYTKAVAEAINFLVEELDVRFKDVYENIISNGTTSLCSLKRVEEHIVQLKRTLKVITNV